MPDPNPAPAPAPAPANPADPNPNPAPTPDPAPNPNPTPSPTPTPAKGWGETWRKDLAGEDDKALKQLERFTTPKALWDSYQEAYQKIRSGELLKPLPENATPEQVAAYRKERGLPEKPEGYLEKLPDGLVIGENDRPIFESFVKGLHELNADPKLAHYAVQWYSDFQEQQAAKAAETDATHRTEVEDALRAEWAGDYRNNIKIANTFLDKALPNGLGDKLRNARDAEGRLLVNQPQMLNWLITEARAQGYSSTIVSGSSGNQPQAVEDAIGKIEKFMRTNSKEYYRDEKMQAELRKLYEDRERLRSRAA